MKKTLIKKLSINKETVANLANLEMKAVKAGISPTMTCVERCLTKTQCTIGCPTEIEWYCGTSQQCTVPCS